MTDPTKKPTLGNRGKTVIASPRVKPLARRHVTVKPSSYQPSKAELQADMNVKATPEGLRDAVSGREGIRRRLTQGP